jgi:hypothetical protein
MEHMIGGMYRDSQDLQSLENSLNIIRKMQVDKEKMIKKKEMSDLLKEIKYHGSLAVQ